MIRNYTNFGNSWISSAKGVADYINLKWKNHFLWEDKLKEGNTKGRVSKIIFQKISIINVYFPNSSFQEEITEIINKIEELVIENRENG